MSELLERITSAQVGEPLAAGHVQRYQYAAAAAQPGDVVMDVACGVGYGAAFFHGVDYHGYDRPDVPDVQWAPPGGTATWHACDLNDRLWTPAIDADVTCCFETLEHVERPDMLAARLARWTGRYIVVSVPTVPTAAGHPYHLHDFTVDQVPSLFPGWTVADRWEQRSELSHVWLLAWH